MKKISKMVFVLGLLTVFLMVGAGVAGAKATSEKSLLISISLVCTNTGGAWSSPGPSGYDECAYSYGAAGFTLWGVLGTCEPWQTMVIVFDKPMYLRCDGESSASGPGYGRCGNEAGKTDDSVIVNTCHGASVIFDEGACAGKCTVGPKVLATAKKGLSQLDGEVLGQAYVKLRNPGGGSYKICFNGEGTIYKWVSGAWVAQSTQTLNGVSCAWSSGDGNYVLLAGE